MKILILGKVVDLSSNPASEQAWSLVHSALWAPLSGGSGVETVPEWEHLF